MNLKFRLVESYTNCKNEKKNSIMANSISNNSSGANQASSSSSSPFKEKTTPIFKLGVAF